MAWWRLARSAALPSLRTSPTPAGVLVVEDASLDARFAQNPLVTGAPYIRFYAGATIRGATGQPLGTLHVAGREPRTLDAAGRQRLATLAIGIAALIELHTTATTLQQASTTDPLTGLGNRAAFDEQLDRIFPAASAERPLALLLIDIDRFKMINDRYGFAMGDTLLALSARRLQGVLREGDFVARLGGDEFAVLAPFLRDEAEAVAVARKIAAALSDPAEPTAARRSFVTDYPSLTASIGVAVCPRDAEDQGSLVRAAGGPRSIGPSGQEAAASSVRAARPCAPDEEGHRSDANSSRIC